ncbi:MAG: PQQ-dependent sugar dehydrogenase [Deltaproteobacteria bacterium]|nr:PQQ-dependent sugar dehydrogenase [Deltaproteobacteria bacterium]
MFCHKILPKYILKAALTILVLIAFVTFSHAQPFGIENRVPNTSLLITDLPAAEPGAMQIERVFPELSFSRPVLIIEIPDESGRLAVVQKNGLIGVFTNSPNPAADDVSTFLDISGRVLNAGEQGLLGLAFDPDYKDNGQFYVYYSWNGTNPGTSRISRFTNDSPAQNSVNSNSEEILLQIPQPYTNHNGGMIAFGPDDMLYIALGDGGSGGDPLNSGQDTTTLLGSILRIDVRAAPDSGLNYHIPTDNPFFNGGPDGTATSKEIYAYGLRNPWRFSFDALNGYLFAGDVGQGAREEIDVITSGGNYGWNIMEGTFCYNSPQCDTSGLIFPVVDYGRSEGNSVTGGYVYLGDQVPSLYGMYIYGDFGSGRIWGFRYDGTNLDGPYTLVGSSGLNISGFGQDATGEVYVLDFSSGNVYVLRPLNSDGDFPTRLSDIPALLAAGTGIDQTNNGIIPYEPSAKLWSDGTLKERFMALPNLDRIGYRMSAGWDFSEHSVVIKNFILPLDERDPINTAQRIETRLLLKKNNQWHGFSYEWNDMGTDAQLLWSAKTKTYSIVDKDGQSVTINYLYPSRSQCIQCHTNAANGILGLNTPQMNFNFTYPASGVNDNQLRTYDHIALFTASLPDSPAQLPKMPDSNDAAASWQQRARAYLAANCAMCHRPGGTAPTSLDFRWEIGNSQMNAINVPPGNGDLGIQGALIISTRDIAKSILLRRIELRDGLFQMPPLGTSRPDQQGEYVIRQWILSLRSRSIVPVLPVLLFD